MNSQTKNFLLLGLLVLISTSLFYGCKKDDDANPNSNENEIPDFVLQESVFDCSNYETFDPDFSDNIKTIHKFGDHIFLATFGEQLIIKEELGTPMVKEVEMAVNKFVSNEMKLLVCAFDGIFEIDQDLNIEQKSEVNCIDMNIDQEGKILVTVSGLGNVHSSHLIYELDPVENNLTPYLDNYDFSNCISIIRFLVHENNDIWATTCSQSILQFRNGQLINQFGPANSPLTESDANGSEIHLVEYKDGVILVAKNTTYRIAKFANESWTLLKELGIDDDSERDRYMYIASINPPIIYEDQLYVPTTIAGCRGIQRFDITKDELLEEEDYEVIHDPSFPSQCIDEIYIDENGKFYVSDQHQITSMDCL